MDKLSKIMHKKIPTHSRRITALHENKKLTESASIFGKRLMMHYIQADIPKMDYRNLLGHHLLHKLPEIETYKEVKKLVAARLSACGRDKNLEWEEMINDIEGIEADRTANGLSNVRPGKKH